MSKLTKNQKLAAEKIEVGKSYSLAEAAQLVKDITFKDYDGNERTETHYFNMEKKLWN